MARATWKTHEKHGTLTKRADLPSSVFAFPKERAEPMTDAKHVRNAVARFDQVTGVSDEERAVAFANIKKAAKHYDVDLSETDWSDLGSRPKTGRTAADRKRSAKKGAATRKKTTRKKATHKKATRKKTTRKKSPARKKTAKKRTAKRA
jgi:hypothetical protein